VAEAGIDLGAAGGTGEGPAVVAAVVTALERVIDPTSPD
jgi:hypothetical protein